MFNLCLSLVPAPLDSTLQLQQHSPATPGYQLDTDQYTMPPPPPLLPPFPYPPTPQPFYTSCGESTSSLFTADLTRQQFPDPNSFISAQGLGRSAISLLIINVINLLDSHIIMFPEFSKLKPEFDQI